MSEDESIEAGRHTSQALKALLSAALVVADAQRQRAVREMHRLESEARDRERAATVRGRVDATLGRLDTTTTVAGAGVPVALKNPVELAQRWAAAQQPDADPGERVELGPTLTPGEVAVARVIDTARRAAQTGISPGLASGDQPVPGTRKDAERGMGR